MWRNQGMDILSQTDENLKAAVANESLARNRYSYFAEMARKEGYRYIAKIFEEIAENEKYHAIEDLKLLLGNRFGTQICQSTYVYSRVVRRLPGPQI